MEIEFVKEQCLKEWDRSVIQKAVEHYGRVRQVDKLFEEAGELLTAVAKGVHGEDSGLHIAEEIADVGIMLDQTKIIFGCEKLCEDFRAIKLRRLEERMRADV